LRLALLAVAVSALLFVGCGAVSYPGEGEGGGAPPATVVAGPSVAFPGVTVFVELAVTEAQREKGLGGHAPLADRNGMLFVWDQPGPYAFWMKGMTFALDIMWIEGEKVVYLAAGAPPPPAGQNDGALPIYAPPVPARYVLEVDAGFARKYAIDVGTPAQVRGF
jgi:uncharacterized membrane protein (UPF0127 family)